AAAVVAEHGDPPAAQAALEDPGGDEDVGHRVPCAHLHGVLDVAEAERPHRGGGAQHASSIPDAPPGVETPGGRRVDRTGPLAPGYPPGQGSFLAGGLWVPCCASGPRPPRRARATTTTDCRQPGRGAAGPRTERERRSEERRVGEER